MEEIKDKRNYCDVKKKRGFIYRGAEAAAGRLLRSKQKGIWYSDNAEKDLRSLSPGKVGDELFRYYTEKLYLGGWIVAVGLVLSILFGAVELKRYCEIPEYLERNDHGGGRITYELIGEVNGRREAISYSLDEIEYSEKELEEMGGPAMKAAVEQMLGENTSAHVASDLNFSDSLEGYPFELRWDCENYHLIDMSGKLASEGIADEGTETYVTLTMSCQEYLNEKRIELMLFPRDAEEKSLEESLIDSIRCEDEPGKTESHIRLPGQLNGADVSWRRMPDLRVFLFFPGAVILAVWLYFQKDWDLRSEVEKREKQMRNDYAGMTSKLSLFLEAGMTIRGAWQKIASDYELQKREGARGRFLYEEMLITAREIDSGVPEAEAYERFGKRCRNPLFLKFSTLLVQNLKKGSTQLGPVLQEECRIAFSDAKMIAKKAGEEAQTKLLFPMMLMLGVVMVMIMVPALMTF